MREQTFEGGSQKGDMSCFIRRDLLEVCVKLGAVTGFGEISLCEVGKTFTIEFILKMLKRQGVIEDTSISDSLSLVDWTSKSRAHKDEFDQLKEPHVGLDIFKA